MALDGKDAGDLGAGLKEGLPAGEHQLVLSGSGYYWQGSVTVQTGKTVSVEAYPREVGNIDYSIPEGAQAELSAKDVRTVLRGSGKLGNVYAQTYALHLTGTDYEPADTTVTVSRGQTVSVAPALDRTEAYRRAALRSDLSAAVEQLGTLAAAGRVVSVSDVKEAETLEARIAAAEFPFADIAEGAKALHEELASRLENQGGEAARADFARQLSDLESLRSGSRNVVDADVSAAQSLSVEIAASVYATDELRERGQALVYDLKVRALTDRKRALETKLAQVTRSRRALLGAEGAIVGLGVAGGVAGVQRG